MVGPKVAAAAAQRALEVLVEEDPTVERQLGEAASNDHPANGQNGGANGAANGLEGILKLL
jgi:hypothetical protein